MTPRARPAQAPPEAAPQPTALGPAVVWEHINGREWIAVYPDRKVRTGYLWPDQPPVIWRAIVAPAAGDDVWYASPGEDWRAG